MTEPIIEPLEIFDSSSNNNTCILDTIENNDCDNKQEKCEGSDSIVLNLDDKVERDISSINKDVGYITCNDNIAISLKLEDKVEQETNNINKDVSCDTSNITVLERRNILSDSENNISEILLGQTSVNNCNTTDGANSNEINTAEDLKIDNYLPQKSNSEYQTIEILDINAQKVPDSRNDTFETMTIVLINDDSINGSSVNNCNQTSQINSDEINTLKDIEVDHSFIQHTAVEHQTIEILNNTQKEITSVKKKTKLKSRVSTKNNTKRKNSLFKLPRYTSLIKRFLDDEPPKYEDVTGEKLNTELEDQNQIVPHVERERRPEPPSSRNLCFSFVVLLFLIFIISIVIATQFSP